MNMAAWNLPRLELILVPGPLHWQLLSVFTTLSPARRAGHVLLGCVVWIH